MQQTNGKRRNGASMHACSSIQRKNPHTVLVSACVFVLSHRPHNEYPGVHAPRATREVYGIPSCRRENFKRGFCLLYRSREGSTCTAFWIVKTSSLTALQASEIVYFVQCAVPTMLDLSAQQPSNPQWMVVSGDTKVSQGWALSCSKVLSLIPALSGMQAAPLSR